MTGAVIKPVVIPPTLPRPDGHPAGAPSGTPAPRRTLPLPTVSTPRTSSTVYGLATVDCRGRVADRRVVVTALGWVPGTRLVLRERGGLLVLRPDAHGAISVTKQGHLRLPATVRHRCSLIPGDRVLLAADPQRGLLIVHPAAALDDLLTPPHAELLDGDIA